ncbi:MAG: type IX secretion system sortase PorU [Lentimicrobium sp.]|nr:type IX secretion system sortase PorU [Lentimicrobium sp.]
MIKQSIIYNFLVLIVIVFATNNLNAQHQIVKWQNPLPESGTTRSWLFCYDCYTSEESRLPVLVVNLKAGVTEKVFLLSEEVFAPLDSLEKVALKFAETASLSDKITVTTTSLGNITEYTHQISFVPLRKNPVSGKVEKLVSFHIDSEEIQSSGRELKQESAYAANSVLASGDWYRMAVEQNGIHRLTFNDLSSMGIQVSGLNSSAIRIHGFGGRMLPERAGNTRHDDLPEVPIMVFDGGDGKMDQGDFILFYAQGPTEWYWNPVTGIFNHRKHLYSDFTYYFISVNSGNGTRMMEFPQPQSPAATSLDYYDWYYAIHPDQFSLVKSGKEWFGDVFDIVSSRNYNLPAFNPATSAETSLRLSVAARSTAISNFTLSAGSNSFTLQVPPIIIEPSTAFARMSVETFKTTLSSPISQVNLKYNKSLSSSIGWINFIEINAPAELRFTGGTMHFRKAGTTGIVEYNANGNGKVAQLWDVTNPQQPGYIQPFVLGDGFRFKALSDTIREYVVTDDASYLKPVYIEKVVNQNLHGAQPHAMVIVSHPDFMDQAARLAEFHGAQNNLDVLVVTPQSIYNEFSSGIQDISAIRDFMRMLWKKADSWNKPKFLLLFGDASYDYKDYITGNSNFVPTYQTVESLHPVNSYATDDFFGSLDDHEGGLATDMVDIGVGRLVVQTPEQAKNAVDKIIHYATSDKVFGDWRNVIAFIADDEDSNEHMHQANQLATMIDSTYSAYITEKIFLDAYPQISTPGGQRIPDATLAINQRMEKGALIVNYTGHGGETGWAHERVLEINDINSWRNYDRLPVFMTATCEFSRYDDPLRVSGGELVFLNPRGGGVALFTTARPTYGTPNFNLAKNFYNLALKPTEHGMPFLGELIQSSKMLTGADPNGKKFVLLGDPALKMAYPEFKVYTTSINGNEVSYIADTLKAMEEVTISGYIGDENGMPITGFSGIITPTVFDKETIVETLGSDGFSRMTFSVRRNIIYKGKALVENGYFNISFIVPRDIAYQYGNGKVSYYATDGIIDAAGFYDRIVVGGISNNQITDYDGPEIRLFINDTLFRAGGFTNENPVFLAYVSDESGINTIGNSIGHDIVAILDGKTDAPFLLNDFYEADLNTYRSGRISFPFRSLEPGPHTVKLKLWDVNNNSSERSIDFVVSSSAELVLGQFEVYPNPFSYNAQFIFEHNKAGENLDLELGIFSLMGKQVAVFNRTIFAEGYRSPAFDWDGRGFNGNYITPGFYIGRLRVRDESGDESVASVKVSVIR